MLDSFSFKSSSSVLSHLTACFSFSSGGTTATSQHSVGRLHRKAELCAVFICCCDANLLSFDTVNGQQASNQHYSTRSGSTRHPANNSNSWPRFWQHTPAPGSHPLCRHSRLLHTHPPTLSSHLTSVSLLPHIRPPASSRIRLVTPVAAAANSVDATKHQPRPYTTVEPA